MAVEHLTATGRGDKAIAEGVSTRYGLNVFESTVEVSAASSDGSTYKMALVPSSARISAQSKIITDDLASTGSPVMLVGVSGDQITNDPDAMHTGADVTAAAGVSESILEDPADAGKYLWELAGESSDPGGMIWIQFEVETAATNTGGTATLSLVYHVDGS
jgi:hypothetical protein